MLFVIRLLLVAVGAVFALAVLCGIAVLLLVWAVRRTWARLTGRPVAPWVLKTDPLAVWRQAAAFRRGAGFQPRADGDIASASGAGPGRRRELGDVTDVTPK